MKRIFPIITILILLSLLGLIFFQILWIKGSLETEEQKFMEHVAIATNQAAEDLILEKGNLMPIIKQKPFIFPSERLQGELYRPTITQRYSMEEIKNIIQKAFEKQNLKKVPFEFAVSTTSIIGNEMQSENYYKLYSDSVHNRGVAIPLEAPSGSNAEGISPDEILVIIVPHVRNLIWKSMTRIIIVSVIFTIIIMCAFLLQLGH